MRRSSRECQEPGNRAARSRRVAKRVLKERREEFYELHVEVQEDFALSRAIRGGGEATARVDKQERLEIIAN